jgi:hypothetical protein
MPRLRGLVLLAALALLAPASRLPAQEQPRSPDANARLSPLASRTPLIFASPIHGGCYIAAPGQCKIHVEPFTIDIAAGKKLAQFSLVAIRIGTGVQTVLYDWRPDQSNPVPYTGSQYTPSLVTQDFAATCGGSYQVSLQGKDTGDLNALNLGLTGTFTCPTAVP